MLNRQFEEDQRLLEHEKQQYKMQVHIVSDVISLCFGNLADIEFLIIVFQFDTIILCQL